MRLNTAPITGPDPYSLDMTPLNYYDYYYSVTAIDNHGLEGETACSLNPERTENTVIAKPKILPAWNRQWYNNDVTLSL